MIVLQEKEQAAIAAERKEDRMKQIQLMARRRAGLDDPPGGGHHTAQASYKPFLQAAYPHNTVHHSQPNNKQISHTDSVNGDGFLRAGSPTDTDIAVTCINGTFSDEWLL